MCNDFYHEGQKDKKKVQNKIWHPWTNEFYNSSGEGDCQVKNGDKEHMDLEVNCKSVDDQVYRLAKSRRLNKT